MFLKTFFLVLFLAMMETHIMHDTAHDGPGSLSSLNNSTMREERNLSCLVSSEKNGSLNVNNQYECKSCQNSTRQVINGKVVNQSLDCTNLQITRDFCEHFEVNDNETSTICFCQNAPMCNFPIGEPELLIGAKFPIGEKLPIKFSDALHALSSAAPIKISIIMVLFVSIIHMGQSFQPQMCT